jgi:RNA exonuclease 4
MDLSALSSNWRKLQQDLIISKTSGPPKPSTVSSQKRKQTEDIREPERPLLKKQKLGKINEPTTIDTRRKGTHGVQSLSMRDRSKSFSETKDVESNVSGRPSTSHSRNPVYSVPIENEGVSEISFAGKYIALDCEFVGVGSRPPYQNQVARVSLVNYHGEQLYDTYVKPQLPVADYRTFVSGIRPHNLRQGRPFKEVQSDVATFLRGRIVVGHSVSKDLKVLRISHPYSAIRDSAELLKLKRSDGGTASLKELASTIVGLDIQKGEHSSVEDARASMLIFRQEKEAFETQWKSLVERSRSQPQQRTNGNDIAKKPQTKKPKKKKKR